ncbi:hypothetical protein PHMEG_0001651 [Phytophthora megakarya]|uniref:Uncharacterized protein n=1 Tax=Phytophthora megakarya TaxID=4795 RepID=A0A225WZX1_9STRA|nr:hypothetical protein PHMEG_0001651 [Phytophthora megakarya]
MTLEPTKKSPSVVNLMSRADSVDIIMLPHIEWSENCLIVEEHKVTKPRQTSSESMCSQPFSSCLHVPYLPLSFLFSLVLNVELELFFGNDNKDQFGRILGRVIEALSEEEW